LPVHRPQLHDRLQVVLREEQLGGKRRPFLRDQLVQHLEVQPRVLPVDPVDHVRDRVGAGGEQRRPGVLALRRALAVELLHQRGQPLGLRFHLGSVVRAEDRGEAQPEKEGESGAGDEALHDDHSTVTAFARLRGLSTSLPSVTAIWYARSWSGTTVTMGETSSAVSGTSMTWRDSAFTFLSPGFATVMRMPPRASISFMFERIL